MGERKDKCKSDNVYRVRMINNPCGAVCSLYLNGMIEKMAWKFAGRSATVFESPYYPVAVALLIDLNNADICFGVTV